MMLMDDIPVAVAPHSGRFLDQLRLFIRSKNLAYATEKTYVSWILQFIRFHNKRHPKDLDAHHIEAFLSFLSTERFCSQSTQRTALNALVFLYREFLKRDDLKHLNFNYSNKQRRIPTVFSHQEATCVISQLRGVYRLMASLMYGSGLRISEVLRLRVKDIDFEMNNIVVRSGKGDKDRMTLLAQSQVEALQDQIQKVALLHKEDCENGYGEVYLPNALSKKYKSAAKSLAWQYLFPASKISKDPRCKTLRRHHLDKTALAKNVAKAIRQAKIYKKASSHTFRHSFATRLLENNYGRFFAPAKPAYITSM